MHCNTIFKIILCNNQTTLYIKLFQYDTHSSTFLIQRNMNKLSLLCKFVSYLLGSILKFADCMNNSVCLKNQNAAKNKLHFTNFFLKMLR